MRQNLQPVRPPRLFFALWPDVPATERLSGLARDASARWGGSAMRPASLHLTLAFLGEIAEERCSALHVVGEELQLPAFEFWLDRCAYWAHNRIFWAGCREPSRDLQYLVSRLADCLRQSGFRLEERAFSAHVTLVRHMEKRPEPLPKYPPICWCADELCLVQSVPSSGGVDYRKLASWRLLT